MHPNPCSVGRGMRHLNSLVWQWEGVWGGKVGWLVVMRRAGVF